MLVSVDLTPLPLEDSEAVTLGVIKGHLLTTPRRPGGIVGLVLSGATHDGKPVEVAICGAEPDHDDPSMRWYRIEAWNPIAREWENPCSVSDDIPDPRALPVQGVWDASGALQKARGKLTLACENGAIARCIRWGYKPWDSREGKSLADLHQACTRMVLADYCGNGKSHIQDSAILDMYDAFGVLGRTTEATAASNPSRTSFEAAWVPDGAFCMARTRNGEDLADILRECPGRFTEDSRLNLLDGDHCIVRRQDSAPDTILLRNRSYSRLMGAGLPGQVK